MSGARLCLLAVPALIAASILASEPAAPVNRESIAQWIKQLGDDDFRRREEASRQLILAGESADTALEAVSQSPDPEVARRARDILEKSKWGIYPDTPKKIVELIQRYQAGDRAASSAIIRELFENGTAGCKAVLKIARAEEDAGIRRRLFAQICNEMPRAVPQLLLEDHLDTLNILLETTLDHDPRDAAGNYVALCILRGTLDERIASMKARAAKCATDTKALEILAYLYRAKGDLAAARAAAKKAGDNDLLAALLGDAGDWKALAGLPVGSDLTLESEKQGLRAAYCRLAKDNKGLEEALSALRKLADDSKGDEATELLVAKALFLNSRPQDALDVLVRHGDRAMAFEILVARMQFHEALKLVDAERQAHGTQLPQLEILGARALWALGEKDKARSVFERYGNQLQADTSPMLSDTLIESELRVGLREQALGHAAKVMALSKESAVPRRILTMIFPNKHSAAELWWDHLRNRNPEHDPVDTLNQVAAILRGEMRPDRVREIVASARDAWNRLVPQPDVAETRELALAEAAIVANNRDLALSVLEKATTSGGLQKLGDLLAELKLWERAANAYRRSWEADRQKPLSLYLWGHALVMAGQKKEGSQHMEQAHWLPLGNQESRNSFAVALGQRGQREAARRENDLLLRSSVPASYFAGEAQRRAALEARVRGDYLRSADGQERAMLRCLRAYISFVEAPAYVSVPAMIHRQRARGFLAADRLDDALDEAMQCLDEEPGDVDVPILLLPSLEKANRKKDADRLFGRVYEVFEVICKEFPNCSWAHNSLAWLSACCRRDLDGGLVHARMAVQLEPSTAGYRDTLAEVSFQLGNKNEAIAQQKKAVELEPKKPYYRKQLERMQAGKPTAPRPAEDEDDEE